MRKDLKEGLVSELKPIREGMKNLPTVITFPQFPSIAAYDDDDDSEEEEDVFIGDIADQYLRKFATVSGADKTFGLRDKDGKFYIWNKEAEIKANNIIVSDKTYTGTPRLWELIVARSPDNKIFTNGDYDNYAEIMHSTNALRRNNDESETKSKAKKRWKLRRILKPIWDEKELYTVKDLTAALPTIILPSHPIALVERLYIRMASKAAGNTGARNELESVQDRT